VPGVQAPWRSSLWPVSECPATYDADADATYLPVAPTIGLGESTETIVIERLSGTLIIDFDAAGHLLGVEVLGARSLLTEPTLERLHRLH
jgi:uncharacterized protein YuzE